jgi:hypothetical protein
MMLIIGEFHDQGDNNITIYAHRPVGGWPHSCPLITIHLTPPWSWNLTIERYGSLTKTETGKPYYQGKTESSAELFVSRTQMEIASQGTSLFLDGTFSACPFPFYQVVFLRTRVGVNRYTIGSALLPNKMEQTYVDVLKLFKDCCERENIYLDFNYAHHDCERSIINAVKKEFPQTQIKLCWFHIVDAIRKQANSHGLRWIRRK